MAITHEDSGVVIFENGKRGTATVSLDAGGSPAGGGTQYTEGDADATITGTAILHEPDTGTSALQTVSPSNPLYVRQAALTQANDIVSAVGNVAHDAADASNPVKVGHKAIAHGTNPTAVAAADRTDWYANRAGVPFVIGGHPNPITTEWTIADADGAQTNAALITVSAGTKIILTRLMVTADADNTVSVACRIGFGAATVPAAALAGAVGVVASHPDIPAGGGFVLGNGGGILAVGADGEDLRLTCDDPVTGSIVITATHYTIES